MLATAPKIDPRVRRTRQLLTDALGQLLMEQSFDDITVQDIAARATVNRATFYAHFVDKYALVNELIRDGFAQTLAAHLGAPTDSPEQYLRRLFLAVTGHMVSVNARCRRSYRMFETLVEAQVKLQLRQCIRAWLVERAPVGAAPSQAELTAAIVSWALYGAAVEWSSQAGSVPAEDFADEAVPLIAASIVR